MELNHVFGPLYYDSKSWHCISDKISTIHCRISCVKEVKHLLGYPEGLDYFGSEKAMLMFVNDAFKRNGHNIEIRQATSKSDQIINKYRLFALANPKKHNSDLYNACLYDAEKCDKDSNDDDESSNDDEEERDKGKKEESGMRSSFLKNDYAMKRHLKQESLRRHCHYSLLSESDIIVIPESHEMIDIDDEIFPGIFNHLRMGGWKEAEDVRHGPLYLAPWAARSVKKGGVMTRNPDNDDENDDDDENENKEDDDEEEGKLVADACDAMDSSNIIARAPRRAAIASGLGGSSSRYISNSTRVSGPAHSIPRSAKRKCDVSLEDTNGRKMILNRDYFKETSKILSYIMYGFKLKEKNDDGDLIGLSTSAAIGAECLSVVKSKRPKRAASIRASELNTKYSLSSRLSKKRKCTYAT